MKKHLKLKRRRRPRQPFEEHRALVTGGDADAAGVGSGSGSGSVDDGRGSLMHGFSE